ncbi:MAG: 4'-phosphopantetheinyl transferase family protein [Chloroflexota bacterium]
MIGGLARSPWVNPPAQLSLPFDETHVWLADLDGDPYESEQIARFLAPDEHELAARVRLQRNRQRWIVARGTLRMLLGRYLDTNPRLIELTYSPQGKPSLVSPDDVDLRFNLSHADDLALFAFSIGRDLGVDLEHCRPDDQEMPVAERLFTLEETAYIATHDGCDRQRAFLRCWTAKDAYLKARGLGLTTAARNHVRVLRADEIIAPRDWVVTQLDPTPDTIGMLAVHGPTRGIQTWYWRSPLQPKYN